MATQDKHEEMSREEFERLAGPHMPRRFDFPQNPEAARDHMVEMLRRLLAETDAERIQGAA